MNGDSVICRKVRLNIYTKQYDQRMISLFDDVFLERLMNGIKNAGIDDEIDGEDFDDFDDSEDLSDFDEDNTVELITEAEYTDDGKRIEIRYEETELTGMEGAVTCISFDKKSPGIISMMRGGTVYTVMIFEEGKRHICAYETNIMPFELCILTKKVSNALEAEADKYLGIDYLIEIRGAKTERTIFHMDVSPIEGNSMIEG